MVDLGDLAKSTSPRSFQVNPFEICREHDLPWPVPGVGLTGLKPRECQILLYSHFCSHCDHVMMCDLSTLCPVSPGLPRETPSPHLS